jgi:large subunit ribosomal protein L21
MSETRTMSDPTDPRTNPEPESPEVETEPESPEPLTAEAEAVEPVAAAESEEPADEPATEGATEEAAAEPIAAEAVASEAVPIAARRAPRGPRPYAVIETGGKQYRVSVGDSISVEKLDAEPGSEIVLDRVLLLGGDGPVRVGTPVVAGATVAARIDEQFRGEKIVVFTYKPKKRYRRKMGHRQSLTRLEIVAINA